MTSRPSPLGFVGLGVMGRPMASHLAAAGHAVTLYDVAPGVAEDVAATLAGASMARTPAELAARSDIVVTMVDAPVSGAEWGAKAAELVFMCGGAAADIERVRPLLEVMGKAVFHLGPLGADHAMKCLNNLVTAINFVAVGERLAIGKRYGLDPAAIERLAHTEITPGATNRAPGA